MGFRLRNAALTWISVFPRDLLQASQPASARASRGVAPCQMGRPLARRGPARRACSVAPSVRVALLEQLITATLPRLFPSAARLARLRLLVPPRPAIAQGAQVDRGAASPGDEPRAAVWERQRPSPAVEICGASAWGSTALNVDVDVHAQDLGTTACKYRMMCTPKCMA